jgi:hypothetical protein
MARRAPDIKVSGSENKALQSCSVKLKASTARANDTFFFYTDKGAVDGERETSRQEDALLGTHPTQSRKRNKPPSACQKCRSGTITGTRAPVKHMFAVIAQWEANDCTASAQTGPPSGSLVRRRPTTCAAGVVSTHTE